MLLTGKTALVTGCNRGIGRAIMGSFAHSGATVWACAREASGELSDHVGRLARETGATIKPLFFDLTDGDAMKAAIKTVMSAKSPVHVLVNNAAAIQTSLFQMTSVESMRGLFEVNFFSQMQLTQLVAKLMVRHRAGGSIVNISSSAAIEGNAGRVAYASSKAALIAATKVLSKELATHGIRVNAVAPGLTQTDMMEQSTPQEYLDQTLQRTCLERVGEPSEIAEAVTFLASDRSSYMTGQVLRVDGGM
jgi:3-oxoacyl-[acyl-carrier protein] reductase